jgi:hypothetical protein
MIVIENHCQLGNQMFIYAAARSLGLKNKQTYCLSNLGILSRYFVLTKSDNLFNGIKYFMFRLKNKISPFTFYHLQDNFKDYTLLMDKNRGKNVWYYGYFQGENYFENYSNEIKKCFQLKPAHISKFQKTVTNLRINKPMLCVHIRRKDYLTFGPDYLKGPDMTLPKSYYTDILNGFNLSKYHLIFTSDDIGWVKNEFSEFNYAYFSDNEAIIDLQFIINADVAIISHSTFAWWGAWLNQKPNKQIIVPKFFLGFKINRDYPVNIIPSNWTKQQVNG